MATRKCGKGMYYRKSYTRKGTRISGKCLRSQTKYTSGPKSTMGRRLRGVRRTKRALRGCPSGYVKRAAFMRYTKRGKHSLVPEQCIKNIGAPGKGYRGGPGIGPLRKGELTKYGYKNVAAMSTEDRHVALEKAVAAYGPLSTWRKLNAVAVYTRRTAPGVSKVFKADMDWIRREFGLKAF